MRIGLFGMFFNSDNLGCAALACSVLQMLSKIQREKQIPITYIVFEQDADSQLLRTFETEMNLEHSDLVYAPAAWVRNLRMFARYKDHEQMKKMICSCDLILDITGGDSFSDIYGKKRFYFWTNIKKFVIDKGIPLVLMPQTYGPFENGDCRKLAKEILQKAELVIVRDDMSGEELKTFVNRKIYITTDVAFELPAVPMELPENNIGRKKLGLNVSGLLYLKKSDSRLEGAELKVDYIQYIDRILERLIEMQEYDIYLISHVQADYEAAKMVKERFPTVSVLPFVKDPMKLKGIIGKMDAFIGSRMHATVAAFSQKIITIPVAYSRKFEGLFSTIGYDVNVDLCNLDQQMAVDRTLLYLKQCEEIRQKVNKSYQNLETRLSINRRLIEKVLIKYSKGKSTPLNRWEVRVAQKMCSGCGICKDYANMVLHEDENGFLTPRIMNNEQMSFCCQICPAFGKQMKRQSENIWGNYKAVFLGNSSDPEIRFKASSGGVLTAISCYLLVHNKVDGILQIGVSEKAPYQTELVCSRSIDEVRRCMGSRYTVSTTLLTLKSYLQSNERYALIGKPCDITVVRNMMEMEPELQTHIPYLFSFFCAGMPGYQANRKLIHTLLNEEECKELQYRGNGWPGHAAVTGVSGRTETMDYENSWGKILGRETKYFCKFCADGIGEMADISCGDAWHLTEDKKPDFRESDGRNVIFARTEIGIEILQGMIKEGYIETESFENDLEQLAFMQPYQYRRKATMYAALSAMRLFFKTVPFYDNKLLKSWRVDVNPKEERKVFLGTVKRILKNRL